MLEVTQGVHADLWQPRPLGGDRRRPQQVPRVNRQPELSGEDEACVLPQIASPQTLGHLLGPVLGDQPNHGRAQRHNPA
jgi:hypothetical protein